MLKRLFIMLVLGIASLSAIAQSDDPEPGGHTPNPSVPPSISLAYNASLSRLAAPGSIMLIANAEAFDSTIASISIHNGSTLLGTVKAGTNTFSWNNVPAGTHALTAVATDSRGLWTRSVPLSVTVTGNAAPTVALTATLTGATAPGSIALSVTASDSDGSISKVEFFNGTALLATVTQAPYTFTWSNVAAGSFSLSARATDNGGATSTTQPQVVTVAAAGAQVYYLYADQVNAAREITSAAGTVVWRADVTEPFGANIPNENPSNQGGFTYNMRFPGQYFDKETGLHSNYFRDYDSKFGRYIQSDPIGLAGGLNTYGYVEANPLLNIDPFGLQSVTGEYGGGRAGRLPLPGDILAPGTPANDAFVDVWYRISDATQFPSTGKCKASEFDFCAVKCGGASKVKGCYVSIRWKTRRLYPGTGGLIREEQRIINCNCDC